MNLIKIPRNIFQTWETKKLSDGFNSLTESWRQKNPNYAYFLYDNDDCEQFIKKHFDLRVYNSYCRIIPGAFKADLWRYCILYIYGGVYVDIDTICLESIDLFLNEDIEFMTPIDLNNNPYIGTHNLFNAFIASIPRHPILLNCINRIIYNVENNIIPSSNLDFSGPGILGRATNTFLKLNETTSFIGKEGIIDNTIYFLKFECYTEYVKDKSNNIILFQNKNGNIEIQKIYNEEIKKINHIDWGKCKNPIRSINS
jgi:mannosyltransferase OCH1-like enzyme